MPTELTMLDIPANIAGRSDSIHPTLIWDQDTAILVDAGFPGQAPQIRQAIEQAGVPFDMLRRVIITHHDIDHIGGLSGILKEAPGPVEVLSHEDERAYVQGDKQPLKLAQLEANLAAGVASQPEARDMFEKMKAGFAASKVRVDQTLVDGQVLPYCGGITVIFTPGHTLGHISLYLAPSKTLIAGDALRVTDGHLAANPDRINYDAALYRESLKKLAALDIETIICYHGGLYQGNVPQQIAALAEAA